MELFVDHLRFGVWADLIRDGGKLIKGGAPLLIGGMRHGNGKVILALQR